MFSIHRRDLMWGGRKLSFETGRIGRQADGAVLVSYGDTVVLCTAVAQKEPKPDVDFFPLTVNYQEKTFAVGKIPGGFFKREGRPSEKEVLTSRLIDRPIRPLFAKGFQNETQVICTVLSHDIENDPDVVSLVGASAALTISGIPFTGPVGGARVGYISEKFILNPSPDELKESALDMVVAGTTEAVLMVESEAKQLSEELMLKAVMYAHEEFQPVIKTIIELAQECAKEPWQIPPPSEEKEELRVKLTNIADTSIREAYNESIKQERVEKLSVAKAEAIDILGDEENIKPLLSGLFKDLEKHIVRNHILQTGKRIDGRDTKTVRPIVSEVGVLPRSHGSALFTRGETQALVVATLGTGEDEQIVDALEGEYRENFLLHYNFPPYSVGEASFLRSPGRREIGHGKLAWRATRAVLPSKEDFPYTLRIVSEITESNGSSSMATVCGTSLALMDAGVPIKCSVAGIAMGLILENGEYAILSDILGDEDHLGDMDFKVAGTKNGITSLQMDIKITGITEEIMKAALEQARGGRIEILGEMANAIDTARADVSSNAPRITSFTIPKEKIREVIGTGGKIIREICETTGAKIDIEDDGTIKVASVDGEAGQAAVDWIKNIVAEPEIGVIYEGKVVKIMDFGAFVNFLGPRDGLVHISELADHRVGKVSDVISEGDNVKVKVLGIDARGKVKLSMKVVDQSTGEEINSKKKSSNVEPVESETSA